MAIAATMATTAQAKAPGAPRWDVVEIDQGGIREGVNGDYAKAEAEYSKQMKSVLGRVYEPFAATCYNGRVFNNEKCYFFRKRIQ